MTVQRHTRVDTVEHLGPAFFRGDCFIVFDDNSRLRWRQSDRREWRLTEIWPTEKERLGMAQHIAQGRKLLVIVPIVNTTYSAFIEEVPTHYSTVITGSDEELVDFRLESLDWLPTPLREHAEDARQQLKKRWGNELCLLRPPVTTARFSHEYTNVGLALLWPDTPRRLVERHLDELITSVFDARISHRVSHENLALSTKESGHSNPSPAAIGTVRNHSDDAEGGI